MRTGDEVLFEKRGLDEVKGFAKPKNDDLKQLNTFFEEVRAKITNYYRQFERQEIVITAEALKNAYLCLGDHLKQKTLMEVFTQHNKEMADSLKSGTMKNYFTTTMIYAHVVNAKVGIDMEAFEKK